MRDLEEAIARLRQNMTQAEIARRIGVSQSTLSRWEAGETASAAESALKLMALDAEVTRNAANPVSA